MIQDVVRLYPPLPADFLEAVVLTESRGNPDARSNSDALGLTQIIYKWHSALVNRTALKYGVEPGEAALLDPRVSLDAGANFLRSCYVSDDPKLQSWERAARKYFTGRHDPPPGFADQQGVTTEVHIQKIRDNLELVRSDIKETNMASIRIIHKFIPETNRNYVPTLLNQSGDLGIIVHETGNTRAGASAASEAKFSVEQHGGEHQVSYHFAVDHLGAYQMIPLNRIGYHAGDGCNSRSEDYGCFASVAIETVVGDNNKNKDATRRNLIVLMAMILRGDKSIDFGGTDPSRFKIHRIFPHKKVSSYSKDCPRFMLEDGFVPKLQPLVTQELAGTVLPPPPPPRTLLSYPEGMDASIAKFLFGRAMGNDGVTYAFSESGSISKIWLENGKKVQRFPKLVSVQVHRDSETDWRKYFVFSDGSVIWHTNKTKAAVVATT